MRYTEAISAKAKVLARRKLNGMLYSSQLSAALDNNAKVIADMFKQPYGKARHDLTMEFGAKFNEICNESVWAIHHC